MDLDALAKQCGATFYRHRTNPYQAAVSFSPSSWEKFVAAVNGDTSNLPGMSDDPCPGCRPGVVCRTPLCGRLTKQTLAKMQQVDQTLDQAIASWESHEALTFHKLEK